MIWTELLFQNLEWNDSSEDEAYLSMAELSKTTYLWSKTKFCSVFTDKNTPVISVKHQQQCNKFLGISQIFYLCKVDFRAWWKTSGKNFFCSAMSFHCESTYMHSQKIKHDRHFLGEKVGPCIHHCTAYPVSTVFLWLFGDRFKNSAKNQSTLIWIPFNIMKPKKIKNEWIWDVDIVKSLMF